MPVCVQADAGQMLTRELRKMLEEKKVTFVQSRGWLADVAAGVRAGAKAEKEVELLLTEKAAFQASLDSMVSAGRHSRHAGWRCPGQCFGLEGPQPCNDRVLCCTPAWL